MIEYNADGWFAPGNERPRTCNTFLRTGCRAVAVYRRSTKGRGYVATGYFCADHVQEAGR